MRDDAFNTRLFPTKQVALNVHQKKLCIEDEDLEVEPQPKASLPTDDALCEGKYAPRDVMLECAQCGKKFLFSVGEQEFYKRKKLSPPRTCSPECREQRKAEFERKEEGKALRQVMSPSFPVRTGSASKTVRVTGGIVNEISDLAYLNSLIDSVDEF